MKTSETLVTSHGNNQWRVVFLLLSSRVLCSHCRHYEFCYKRESPGNRRLESLVIFHLSFISQRLLTSSSLCFCALVTVGSRKLPGEANVPQWKTLSRWNVAIPHSSDSSLFLLPFDYISVSIFLSSFAIKREHDFISCKHTNSRRCFNKFIKTWAYWDEERDIRGWRCLENCDF